MIIEERYKKFMDHILLKTSAIRSIYLKDITDISLVINEKTHQFLNEAAQKIFNIGNELFKVVSDKNEYTIGSIAGMQVIVNKSLGEDDYHAYLTYTAENEEPKNVEIQIEKIMKES